MVSSILQKHLTSIQAGGLSAVQRPSKHAPYRMVNHLLAGHLPYASPLLHHTLLRSSAPLQRAQQHCSPGPSAAPAPHAPAAAGRHSSVQHPCRCKRCTGLPGQLQLRLAAACRVAGHAQAALTRLVFDHASMLPHSLNRMHATTATLACRTGLQCCLSCCSAAPAQA